MIQDDRNLCFLLIVVGRSDGIMQSFFRGGGGLAKVSLNEYPCLYLKALLNYLITII